MIFAALKERRADRVQSGDSCFTGNKFHFLLRLYITMIANIVWAIMHVASGAPDV